MRQVVRCISLCFVVCVIVTSGLFSCTSTSKADKTIEIPLSKQQRVYYEIFVASFYDSDGDGMGDLNGISEKIDYLADDLGVSGIWLMPVMKSPTYHKYDVADYYTVDSDYGTIEDFKKLTELCHSRGITVIIDMPINHSSSQNQWFIDACNGIEPYTNWYNFSDTIKTGYHNVPTTGSTSGSATVQSELVVRPGKYYEGHFTSAMPDLNLDDTGVRSEIVNICRYWLDAGVDGFRLDAVHWFFNANTTKNVEFLNWLMGELRQINPDVYVVGEAWTDASVISKLYDGGISSLFNFPFAQSSGKIISSVRASKGQDLSTSLEKWYNSLPASAIDAPFLTNHDQARSSGALMGDIVLQKQAAAVYLLLPGSPFIYYGEEIGMSGGSGKDENKRTAMIWTGTLSKSDKVSGICNSPVGADDIRELENGVAEQLSDSNSLLSFYHDVLSVKKRYPILSDGDFASVKLGSTKICAYLMSKTASKTILVIHNLGTDEEIITLSEVAKALNVQQSDVTVAEVLVASGVPLNNILNYKDNSLVISGHTTLLLQ